MKKNTLVFGTIAGVIVSTFMGVSMAIMASSSSEMDHGNRAMIIGFSAMVVAFSFVFVGIKNYRDKQNGGALSFGQGFLLGVLISFVASTMYVITWGIEYHFFLPDFMDNYAAMQVKELQASGASGAAYDKALKSIETATNNYKNNSFFFALYTYMEILPVGILISLISTLILRRKAMVSLS